MERYDPVKHPRGFWRDALEALVQMGLVFKTRSYLIGLVWAVAVIGGGHALGLPETLGIFLGVPGLILGGQQGLRQVDRELGPLSTLHEQD